MWLPLGAPLPCPPGEVLPLPLCSDRLCPLRRPSASLSSECLLLSVQPLGASSLWCSLNSSGTYSLYQLSPPSPTFYCENIQTYCRVERILQWTPHTHHPGSMINVWLCLIHQTSIQPPICPLIHLFLCVHNKLQISVHYAR